MNPAQEAAWLSFTAPVSRNDRPSEKRKVDSSILSLTSDRHGRQPAVPALRLFRIRFHPYFNRSAGMCRGMPPCPWDVCGGGPGGGLVGFLWGMPETFGGSRNWSFTDVCQRRLNFG